MTDTLLLGPASVDRWIREGRSLPGGGALNMAYHWSRLGLPFRFLSRVGDDEPEVFTDFLERWHIEHTPTLVGHGPSSSIDVVIGDDLDPHMDHFVEGVWSGFRLDADEEAAVRAAARLHVVLVDAAIHEVMRLADDGALDGVSVSGDFLSFRRWDVERFAATFAHLDLAFIGWPGDVDDPVMHGVRDVVRHSGKRLVITLGSRGVFVVDGDDERFFPVEAVPVRGTSIGCGDAFIAAFLASWWTEHDLGRAVAAGAANGAAATAWIRPLPDEAYG